MRSGRSPRLLTKRRLILAIALLAAVLVPLAAFGAASDWWFQGHGPTPLSAPDVVKEGEWAGQRWQLIAYPSTTSGLCFSLTLMGSDADGSSDVGGMGCTPFAGAPRTAETRGHSEMTITFFSGASSSELPAYIVGPVIDKASNVEIRFGAGEVLRVTTFGGPASLGRVRFYATQLPVTVSPPLPRLGPQEGRNFIDKLAGLDSDGTVVACLVPRTAVDGHSPLSDCR